MTHVDDIGVEVENPGPGDYLNGMVSEWSPDHVETEELNSGRIAELCNDIHAKVDEHVRALKERTTMRRREAMALSLSQYETEGGSRLSEAAIALCIAVREGIPLDVGVRPQTAMELKLSAETKFVEARQLLKIGRSPHPPQLNGDPLVCSFGSTTIRRLERHMDVEDPSYDAVLNRVLNRIEHRRPLEEWIRCYLDERGHDVVHQIAVRASTLERGPIEIWAHTSEKLRQPDICMQTDALSMFGSRSEYDFNESDDPLMGAHFVTVYSDGTQEGIPSISVDEGMAQLRELVQGPHLSEAP